MTRLIPLAAALVLAGCGTTSTQQATLAATAVGAASTLGAVAAANNKTAARMVADGQLVCAVGPGFMAVLGFNATGAPAAAMQAACAALGGVGTALPASVNPATVPAVAVTLKPA